MDFLTQVVLFELRKLIRFEELYSDEFIRICIDETLRRLQRENGNRQKTLDKLLAREKELDMLFLKIHYNFVGPVTLPEKDKLPKPQIKMDIRKGVAYGYAFSYTTL